MAKEIPSKILDIDAISSERRNYLDSEVFNYEGDNKQYKYSKCADICEEFIRSYKRNDSQKYHYFDVINDMMANGQITVVIDFFDIFDSQSSSVFEHGHFLYSLIEQNPKLFLKSMRKAAFAVLSEIHYDYAYEIREDFKCVISNANIFKKEITDIVNTDVGHLIYTEDFVVSIMPQKYYVTNMAWSCGACGRLTYKQSIGFRLPRLKKCEYCQSEDIRESIKDAITDTMQEIKLQQKFERIISGRVPKTIMGVIYGKDVINPVQAGDICGVTGIVSTQPNPSPAENAVSEYIIEIQWIEKKADDFLIPDDPKIEEKVKRFIDPANEDEGYQNLIESIAPSVLGHEIIKEALLLQIVGSEVAYFQDNSRHRGEINLLLVGDAGTAKSKVAKYVFQLYARAIYVSGKTTEAGITATVVIPKGGTPVLEAGAYLLASSDNGGLVVCDEMEKTNKEAKDAIAACLDDTQMVEIHKATIHQSIQINNASLHIANPKTGEVWNTEKSIKENTGFENWYLSRFCTFIVRDVVDKELDTQKAKHYLAQFGNTRRQYKIKDGNINDLRLKHKLSYGENTDIKSVPEMAMFNKYVRKHFKPEFDPKSKVGQKLINYYISVRPLNSGKGAKVTIRSLGDLVRFAEASARAHMRNEVTEKDADIAIKIVQASIASSGFNMFTGEERKIKPSDLTNIPEGFFSAKDLLGNKTAAEIVGIDLQTLARKRENRFYKEVALKMKKVVKVIKMYALQKCRDCGGDGFRNEGQLRNQCYSCQGHGGYKQEFNLNDLQHFLSNTGLTNIDIHDLVTSLIKKKVISPKFENGNTYHVVKPYRDALLDLAGIEANVTIAIESDIDKLKQKEMLIKNPEIQEKIDKLKNLMPTQSRDQIKRMLDSVEE